jgi:hypothetical protein
MTSRARLFVKEMYSRSSRTNAVGWLGPLYADEVIYDGKPISRLFTEAWPERSFSIPDKSIGHRSGRPHPVRLRHRRLGQHHPFDSGAIMTDHEEALKAARDSLRNVVSIRDFLLAVQVGSETAVGMLDKIEGKLLEVLEAINEDAP